MNRRSRVPTDKNQWLEFRSANINSTDVAALFGLSPYVTAFELWHRLKSGTMVEIDFNERMKWGTRLETAIAMGIAEDNGWSIQRKSEYIDLPDHRLGSSFDFQIGTDGLLEIKNVDSLVFKEKWIVDGDHVEAPEHIELQVQHQLLVSGLEYAVIGALVGGNRVIMIRRERDEEIISEIKIRAAKFWQSIDENTPPAVDFQRDAEFIIKLNQFVNEGEVLDAVENQELEELARLYRSHSNVLKHVEEQRKEIKARILTIIGKAEKTHGRGFKISAGVTAETQVSYTRKSFRDFRITWAKN